MNDIKGILLDRLFKSSPSNTVTRKEAASILRVHTREVQNIIAELQKDGWQIISDSRGYWMPKSTEDLPQVVRAARTRHRHALSELSDARRFMAIAKSIKRRRQQSLFSV